MRNSERRAGARAVAGLIVATTAGRLIVVAVLAGLLAAAIAVPVVGVAGIVARDAARTFSTMSVPSLSQLPVRSEILDRRGHLLAYYYPGGIDRQPVSYNQISPMMRNAIVAIEDARYYQHGALDPRGTLRAIINNLRHKTIQGGSTLAQQYVKNALILTAGTKQEKLNAYAPTTWRKLRELRIAANVEHEMTKQELLAAYLNAAYFEEGAWGIQVAAERYFSTTAAGLDLAQAAMLAGLVEDPYAYDPVNDAKAALLRRNVVLTQMAKLHYITAAKARAVEVTPLRLHMHNSTLQSGCTAASAKTAAFFCDYVLAVMRKDKAAYGKAYTALTQGTGGLKIYTTLDARDQRAANHAVNYVEPDYSATFNPGGNVDTEVLIQPGTGAIRAIAVDRPYGTGYGQTEQNFAVNTPYDGGRGVQTGSSSKIFTLLTALKQNYPFGFNMKVSSPATLTGYYNCKGQPAGFFPVVNAEGPSKPAVYTLYNGTTQSINVFYAQLEQRVGLCDVVKTAVSLGMTRADGRSLLRPDPKQNDPASVDNYPSFTLGSVYVSPMSMAAAYAAVAARGMYCKPIAISKIVTLNGGRLPVESARCHRVLSTAVADAANYILQGVLSQPSATAGNRGINIPAAAKTGTANGGYYAAFAGYTPRLAGYVSVFNPINPTGAGRMLYSPHSCYRELGFVTADCPPQMFGDNAPGATWQLTFLHAALGSPPPAFVGVSPLSPFLSAGDGVNSPKPPAPPKPPKGGKPTPTPTKTH